MLRICRHTPTQRILEMQSGDAPVGALKENCIAGGYEPADLEELLITEQDYAALIAPTPEEIDALNAKIAQRQSDMATYLPSWTAVESAVNNIANLADAKAYLLRLSRIVYWLAKDQIT